MPTYFQAQKSSFVPRKSSRYCYIVFALIPPNIRILGAIGLWSIEIVMQMRVYILFNRSKRVRRKTFLVKA